MNPHPVFLSNNKKSRLFYSGCQKYVRFQQSLIFIKSWALRAASFLLLMKSPISPPVQLPFSVSSHPLRTIRDPKTKLYA